MDSRGIDVTPNRAPIEPLKRMVARFRLEEVPVIWVNWGVRKDILNIAPSVRRAHNPTGGRDRYWRANPRHPLGDTPLRELGGRGGRRAQRQRRRTSR